MEDLCPGSQPPARPCLAKPTTSEVGKECHGHLWREQADGAGGFLTQFLFVRILDSWAVKRNNTRCVLYLALPR